MNFRSGASKTSASIGSVPAGAEVDVLGSVNDWDLVRYNGKTGYIHGGNLANTKPQVQKQAAAPAQNTNTYKTTQNYFDNNWTGTAVNMNSQTGAWKTVKVNDGYLALRRDTAYDQSNVIGRLYTGDTPVNEAARILLIQGAWIAVLTALGVWLWDRHQRRIVLQGG